jgi:hypothetical protein
MAYTLDEYFAIEQRSERDASISLVRSLPCRVRR